ncbi:cadherin-like beta sandwich domain-containing protein [Heyndrickxia camelliae]|nr:cadherin-like beta sandwich domain-containing protein [Heyndrickxia camelliae]
MQAKSLKMMLAATVISAGTSIWVPPSSADSTSDISSAQTVSVNQLKHLELDGIQMEETFSADVFDYHATVENQQNHVVLHISGNEHQVFTINGNTVKDPSNVILNLKTGSNDFSIVVDDGVDTPVTYTLTIVRKLSDNNLLKNIKLSSGRLSKVFNSNTTNYNVQLPNEVDSLTVSPEVFDSTETVRINGTELKEGSVSVKLPVGKSDIIILVTAENGESKRYILHVVRAAKMNHTSPVKKPTTDKGNGGKKTYSGNETPPVNIANTRNSSEIKNTFSSTQTVSKNTGRMNIGQGTTYIQKTSSQTSGSQMKASQAQLSSLSVSNGTWNKAFSSDEYTYHIAVGNSVDKVTINATARTSGASVSIEGENSTIPLGENAKKTIVSIVVTKDDERKTYVLVIDKDVKEKPTEDSVITTSSSTTNSIQKNNSVQANNNLNTNRIKYSNTNQAKQSASWWGKLWNKILSWF